MSANNTANLMAGICEGFVLAKPLSICKRIGSTVYEVEVFVKKTSGETAEAKIMRLIRNDLNLAAGHDKMNLPQTDRLPERGSL